MKILTPLHVSLPIVCLATLAIVVSAGMVIWNLESVAEPLEVGENPDNKSLTASQASFPEPALASSAPSETYGALPLHFEPNLGQADPAALFIARGRGYTLHLTAKGAVMALQKSSGSPNERKAGSTWLRMSLRGAHPDPFVVGRDRLPGVSNYFVGDREFWRTGVPHFASVRHTDVYPGIDLIFYGSHREIEYDFVIAPGAQPEAIGLEFAGAGAPTVDELGNLVLSLADGEVVHKAPYIYQDVSGIRREVEGRYLLREDGAIGFEVSAYDERRPLIIDPAIAYSTYLGGGDDDYGRDIAVDSDGHAYVAGEARSVDFPTVNAAQGIYEGGNWDGFVSKLSPDGRSLIYSTYLGGDDSDSSYGVAVDGAGNAYVVGVTNSYNFPTTTGAYQTTGVGGILTGYDATVTKLKPNGTLGYSTYLGGGGTDGGRGVAVDKSGQAHVTGLASNGFPMKNAYQGTFAGVRDAFITKLNASGTDLVYSTFLGGGLRDEALDIVLDSTSNALITGLTESTNFPTVNPGQATHGGNKDGFIAKLGSGGSSLVFSTYGGGEFDDYGQGVAVDGAGNAFVVGHTGSSNFPTVNALQPSKTVTGGDDAFVTRFGPSGAVAFSTYLGGTGVDRANGVAVNAAGQPFIIGQTSSKDFPTEASSIGPACTLDAGLSCNDIFLTLMSPSGSSLIQSDYFGGTGVDYGNRAAFDNEGAIYIVGETASTDFPTRNAVQPSRANLLDVFITKFHTSIEIFIAAASPSPNPWMRRLGKQD